jgi:hypothetical protein
LLVRDQIVRANSANLQTLVFFRSIIKIEIVPIIQSKILHGFASIAIFLCTIMMWGVIVVYW